MSTAPYTKDWESYSKLNPELESILPSLANFKFVEPGVTTIQSIRAPSLAKPPSPLVPGVKETDIQIPLRGGTSNTARIYSPEPSNGEKKPLLVFAYGGGYILGKLGMEEANCRAWVKNHGGIAVGISYRLCPEYPWPGPHEDILDAVRWIGENSKHFGADPETGFVLGGTSAGATTMCAISHIWRDKKLSPLLTGLFLAIPAPCIISALPEKYRPLEKSWEQNKNGPIFTREVSDWFAQHVDVQPTDPIRSPLLWPTGHSKLPPTYFVIGGADPWRDCGLIYEKVLREEGIETRVDVFPGLPHAFWVSLPQAGFSRDQRVKADEGLRWLFERVKSE